MFGKKDMPSYAKERVKYKSAPKRYKTRTSRKLKNFYTNGYKQPKEKHVDTINFKIPHEKMKEKAPQKQYTINDMSRQARKSLYTHKEKKPQTDSAKGIRFKATRSMGSLYKGNAVNDRVGNHTDSASKTKRRLAFYRNFYLVVLAIGVIGEALAIAYHNTVPMILFIVLIVMAIYGNLKYYSNG